MTNKEVIETRTTQISEDELVSDAEAKAKADKAEDEAKPFPWWWLLFLIPIIIWMAWLTFRPVPAPVAPTDMPTELAATQPAPTDVPTAVPTDVPTAVPTDVPTAIEAPIVSNDGNQGAIGCQDGKVIGNQFADLTRIPVGTREGAVVIEISWQPGIGFAGYDRAIVIVPVLDAIHQPFILNAATIHMVQYCGSLDAIKTWSPTHVDAMVQTAQASDGSRPKPTEIPIVVLNLDGTILVVKDAPDWPNFLEAFKTRLEMTVQH